MERNYYPHMDPIWRADAIERWLEKSGPLYVTMPVKVISHQTDTTEIEWEDGERSFLDRWRLAYASWFYLRAAEIGSEPEIKIRVDEVSADRQVHSQAE